MLHEIDYVHWTDEDIYKAEIENILTESLYFTSVEDFIKRMISEIPDFKNYIFDKRGNNLYISVSIFSKISAEHFKLLLYKYSYRLAKETEYYVIVRPEHDRQMKFTDMYIHMSPKPDLNITGIRCKPGNGFEEYMSRIYLYPLFQLIHDEYDINDLDSVYNAIRQKCNVIKDRFNLLKKKNDEYYIYLVNLPKAFAIYRDPSQSKDYAVYIENNIPVKYIRQIGKV